MSVPPPKSMSKSTSSLRLGIALVLGALAASVSGCGSNPPELVVSNDDGGIAGGSLGADGSASGGGGHSGGSLIVIADASLSSGDEVTPTCGDACTVADAGPVCGNSIVEDGESCDDGNSTPGDGCSGICRIEPNYACDTPGKPCTSTIICGDGKITGNEACDDGNKVSKDGCSDTCQVESGFACTTAGQACTPVAMAKCGDGMVNNGEGCDDGGTVSGDGCSATCQLEAGYACPTPGQACVKDEYCGDGKLNGTEQCDDGNVVPGDGCTGACTLEPFFTCPTAGQPCTTTIICGDSKVIGDEACDDGNTKAGDGCSADCKSIEPGFTCPSALGVGGACTAVPMDTCGDARLSYGEFCDDGNTKDGDGCDHTCHLEAGYTCPAPGQACQLISWCGDGKLDVADGEDCDDGNTVGGDGCSPQCVVEANFACPVPGKPCVSTVKCGDQKVTGNETCDDGNLNNNDGCSSTCQVESGWTCPVGGVCRAAKCGDGIVAGLERCDDGNSVSGDGCSSTCQLESPGPTERNGWQCLTPGQPCTRTTCGNGIREGSEQCDDGNNNTGDGCSPFCRTEPTCPSGGGACATSCGDGLLLMSDVAAGQVCDDGNTVSGDGCSADCKTVEQGYNCVDTPIVQNPLILPIVYRDFQGNNETTAPHPDFENYNGAYTPIVQPTLNASGKPVHVAADTPVTTNNNPGPPLVTTDYFGMWYVDTPAYNKTILDTLTFFTCDGTPYNIATATCTTGTPVGAFQYRNPPNNYFFPLDGKGWGNSMCGANPCLGHDNLPHNFGFTSEVRYWFEYQGGERLDFLGDDDVWVFINKKLAVDIGGIHGPTNGSIILDGNPAIDPDPTKDGKGQVCDEVTTNCGARRTVDLGLVPHSVYEIVVFQAERHTQGSQYILTLGKFSATRSVCKSVCGDGIVTPNEACDLGAAKNTGAYGTCNTDCTLPPRCGDAIVQANEDCDDGINLSTYGGTGKKCGPGCKWASYCGDSTVDGANGEACDDGSNNGKGYGYCTAGCQLGPRCGDGVVSGPEKCDDGTKNGTSLSLCTADCQWKCGNGVLDPGEQCDDGTTNNVGGYGKCKADCTLGPRCGDGIKNGPEQCDDGKNDGTYGTCAAGCVLGPRCGDGVVQMTAGETCDLGASNDAAAYGQGKCTNRCKVAPYCGDKAVDPTHEKCDDGINNGMPGSCKSDCSDYVPLPSCGDGTVQAPEKCDQGMATNGTQGATCDSHCRLMCGNGTKDFTEQCDDGVNNGSYGTCNANCTLAGYCGDGVVNGPEQCDLGQGNEIAPYGKNKCTTACTAAPYCGDGRIQSNWGEECDGGAGCDTACHFASVK
jgi:fibro-slime domain-containing protein